LVHIQYLNCCKNNFHISKNTKKCCRKRKSKVLSYGVKITKEIVVELLCEMSDLLKEISLPDEHLRNCVLVYLHKGKTFGQKCKYLTQHHDKP